MPEPKLAVKLRDAYSRADYREILVSGDRQTGKTTAMLYLVAGGIAAGGSPVIAARHADERRRLIDALFLLLRDLGVAERDCHSKAQSAVIGPRQQSWGRKGPLYYEEDV